jgi:hypothetical protein
VIDYTQEDLLKNGEVYDLINDLISKRPFSEYNKLLRKTGLLILANSNLFNCIKLKFSSLRIQIGYKNRSTPPL